MYSPLMQTAQRSQLGNYYLVCCCLHCARFMKTAVLMLWQTHVLLLWQQQCQLSSHLAQGALCESFSYDHMKCQLKPIPVLVTTLVIKSYHRHGDRKMEFVCCGVFVSDYSLGGNQLTDTGAIALATALQHNKSLEELK